MSARVMQGFHARTGDLLSQPRFEQLRGESTYSYTSDFRVDFSALGSLDAPDTLPAGGLRLFQGEHVSVAWAHVWRDGVRA